MRIALGVHVSTYEVTASLVDTSLPELGPISSRTVTVAATPGGIGGAVSTALGFMRVQAMQNDLAVVGAAVVCENALQREVVANALAEAETDPPVVIDIFDDRLSDAYTPDVSAALMVDVAVPTESVPAARVPQRKGIWPVAAVGACVLAALGGVTAWAMTAQPAVTGEEVPSAVIVHPSSRAPVPPTTLAPEVGSVVATTTEFETPESVPEVGVADVVLPYVPASEPSTVPSTTSVNEPPPAAPEPTRVTPTVTTKPNPAGGGNGGSTTTSSSTAPVVVPPVVVPPVVVPPVVVPPVNPGPEPAPPAQTIPLDQVS